MPFSTHKCTRECQEETTSPLHIPREGAQAMAKLKCSTSRMTCGAVIAPMPMSSEVLCESHDILGNVVNHMIV